ncbi:hypothetical protein BSF38_00737 [Paludisphaera borealis]|uniref:Uncharacterized protein n=1 Tax=Paludisphaera borealis TaxID=1387353 RepID=A0A1U7CK87_9BACT|nr:hypothetical protein BSF38_00737 [Paludisphaera borealis]
MKPPLCKMLLWALLAAAFCVWEACSRLSPSRPRLPARDSARLRWRLASNREHTAHASIEELIEFVAI